ncbi:helix-turn-helix domain-containing protein [Chitinimonas arctica]|nr:helix-turn-helix domain-containing protein [Chitinimonas arctica]
MHAATTLHPSRVTGVASLARLLNESPQALSNWKRRGLPGDKITAIARTVGCEIDYLELGIGSMTAPLKAPAESASVADPQHADPFAGLDPASKAALQDLFEQIRQAKAAGKSVKGFIAGVRVLIASMAQE